MNNSFGHGLKLPGFCEKKVNTRRLRLAKLRPGNAAEFSRSSQSIHLFQSQNGDLYEMMLLIGSRRDLAEVRRPETTEETRLMAAHVLVFTDLDGTLLSHHDFSLGPARNSLKSLIKIGIPVILNSSKTRAEIRRLLQSIGEQLPFVVENGAAADLPDGFIDQPEGATSINGYWRHEFVSLTADRILQIADELPPALTGGFRPLVRISAGRQSESTGLSGEALEAALTRDYTVPFLWDGGGDQLQMFIDAVRDRGVETTRGGRLYHLRGASSKSAAMAWIAGAYHAKTGVRPRTVALGDSPNDRDMLEQADFAGVVRLPEKDPMRINRPDGFAVSTLPAPEGWVELISKLLPKAGIELNLEARN